MKSLTVLCLIALLLAMGAFMTAQDEAQADTLAPCGGEASCDVAERSYQALVPDGWDGKSKLPVLIHFHGWGRTGTNVIRNQKIAGATRDNGVLLLAPNGLGKSWSFWSAPSRDVPFVEAMIKDAQKRWPIDRSRLYVSGFSYGAAMSWRLACERGGDYAAFLSIAGTLWNFDELKECASPITLRHVHGLKDTVMDLPRGEGGRPLYAVSPWLAADRCAKEPNSQKKIGIFQQYVWTPCESGHDVELELHAGGHLIPAGWLKRQLHRLESAHQKVAG